jgi:hypothetical protein
MANWQKKGVSGEAANVDAGSGSKRDGAKGRGAGGRARGPDVSTTDGGSGRTDSGAGASATEKTHNVEFAKGGDTHMFGEQEANKQRPGYAEKADAHGPGSKFAEGGKNKMFGFAGALPATAGISAARES